MQWGGKIWRFGSTGANGKQWGWYQWHRITNWRWVTLSIFSTQRRSRFGADGIISHKFTTLPILPTFSSDLPLLFTKFSPLCPIFWRRLGRDWGRFGWKSWGQLGEEIREDGVSISSAFSSSLHQLPPCSSNLPHLSQSSQMYTYTSVLGNAYICLYVCSYVFVCVRPYTSVYLCVYISVLNEWINATPTQMGIK